MKTKNIFNKLNLGLAVLVVFSVISFGNIVNSSNANAADRINGSYRNDKTFLFNKTNLNDDRCYSSLSTASSELKDVVSPGGLFDKLLPSYGLVNPIVRVPIYDWDQEPGASDFVRADGQINTTPSSAYGFNTADARPVGYLQKFNFTLTPIPSVKWMKEALTQGDPIKNIIGVGTVASPLIYQQAAVVNEYGAPTFPILNGPSRSEAFNNMGIGNYSSLNLNTDPMKSEYYDKMQEYAERYEKDENGNPKIITDAVKKQGGLVNVYKAYLAALTGPENKQDGSYDSSSGKWMTTNDDDTGSVYEDRDNSWNASSNAKNVYEDAYGVLTKTAEDMIAQGKANGWTDTDMALDTNKINSLLKKAMEYTPIKKGTPIKDMNIEGPGFFYKRSYENYPINFNHFLNYDKRRIHFLAPEFYYKSIDRIGNKILEKGVGQMIYNDIKKDNFDDYQQTKNTINKPITMLNSMNQLLGDRNKYDLKNSLNNLNQKIGNVRRLVKNNTLGPLDGLLGMFARTKFYVDANGSSNTGVYSSDKCFEYANAPNSPGVDEIGQAVPAYAFSVGVPIPITFPGTFMSVITLFNAFSLNGASKGLEFVQQNSSMDGITFWSGRSVNGKYLLDCYGRGTTKTIRTKSMHSDSTLRNKGHDYDNITNYGNRGVIWSVVDAIGSFFESIYHTVFGSDSYDATKAKWRTFGNSLIAAAAASSNGSAASTVANVTDHIPIPYTDNISYYNGFYYLFALDKDSVDRNVSLPEKFRNREIDFDKSQLNWMDGIETVNGDFFRGDAHKDSMNGHTYFPGLYVKLKKPFDLSVDSSNKTRTPDGNEYETTIKIKQTGFKKGGGLVKYDKGGSHSGDMIDNNHVRLVRTVIKPGAYPGSGDNRIDNNDYYEDDIQAKANGNNAARKLTANGLKSGEICRFYRNIIGEDALKDCDDGTDNVIDFNSSNPGLRKMPTDKKKVHNLSIKETIPSETPPGTKFCYSVFIENKDNDAKFKDSRYYRNERYTPNYNDRYHALNKKGYLSRAKCVITGYKPSVQVRTGDLMVTGGVEGDVNYKKVTGTNDHRLFGSYSEYATLAGGGITGGKFGTGAKYRVGQSEGTDPLTRKLDPHGYLTFANSYSSPSSPNYGNYNSNINDGFGRLINFFSDRANKAKNIDDSSCYNSSSKTIKLKDCESGDYNITDNVTIDGESFENNKSKSLVFFVANSKTVTMKNDIKTPSEYDSPQDISQVLFVQKSGRYLINIKPEVSRLDAWLINPNGTLNTCKYSFDGGKTDTPRSFIKMNDNPNANDGYGDHPCRFKDNSGRSNTLQINGPVSVKNLYLRRSSGIDQDPDGKTRIQSVPAETFNLRGDAYIWAINQVTADGGKLQTVKTVDLPPRY